jgi:predicted transcriptional regulator
MAETKIIVGGGLEEDAAALLDAWHRAERGETVDENVLAFESWEALASVLTGERYRLLRHVHAHPEPSISALALSRPPVSPRARRCSGARAGGSHRSLGR